MASALSGSSRTPLCAAHRPRRRSRTPRTRRLRRPDRRAQLLPFTIPFPHALPGVPVPSPSAGVHHAQIRLHSSMNRRLFLTATGALSLSAALSACGGDSGGTGANLRQAGQPGRHRQGDEDADRADVLDLGPEHRQGGRALREEVPGRSRSRSSTPVRATPQYTKLRTALKAGSGAPDMVQMEFQAIPTFTITDSLLDLRPYGASALKATFVDWTWGQVSGSDGEVWAIPQDTGPMGMLYRKDIFDEHGIEVPEDLGRVRRGGPQAPQGRPGRLPHQPRRQRGRPPGTACSGRRAPSRTSPPARATSPSASTTPSPGSSATTGAAWPRRASSASSRTSPTAGTPRSTRASTPPGSPRPGARPSSPARPRPPRASGAPPRCRSGTRPSPARATGAARPPRSSTPPRTRSGGRVRAVPQQRPGQRQDVRHRAVLLPGDQGPARRREFPRGHARLLRRPEGQRGVRGHQFDTVNPAFQWPPFLDRAATDWTETVGKSLADRSDTVRALGAWQSRITTFAKGQGFTVKGG